MGIAAPKSSERSSVNPVVWLVHRSKRRLSRSLDRCTNKSECNGADGNGFPERSGERGNRPSRSWLVFHATGKRVEDKPISIDKLMDATRREPA